MWLEGGKIKEKGKEKNVEIQSTSLFYMKHIIISFYKIEPEIFSPSYGCIYAGIKPFQWPSIGLCKITISYICLNQCLARWKLVKTKNQELPFEK